MNLEELAKLVDKSRSIKDQIDALEVELDKNKKIFREEAKKRKVGHFLGNKNFCRVSPDTSSTCDPEELHQTFSSMERGDEFYECIKPLVGEVKKRLGETLFEEISETTSVPYKKVSFLKSIPKKYQE